MWKGSAKEKWKLGSGKEYRTVDRSNEWDRNGKKPQQPLKGRSTMLLGEISIKILWGFGSKRIT